MTILKTFSDTVKQYPSKVAVMYSGGEFTFQEVDVMSNFIAKQLLLNSDEETVPFYIEKNKYVLPVVLGIMKSGKNPLPITNSLEVKISLERISEVVFDVLISDSDVKLENHSVTLLLLPKKLESYSEYQEVATTKENEIAHIICTSGTTGVPKKVFLTDDNIDWLVKEFYKIVKFTSESKFLFTTPYTFDVSLTEILAPVYTGGTLVCYDGGIQNIIRLGETIEKKKITHLSLSPSFAETIIDISGPEVFQNLRALCLAGETFPSSLANRLRGLIQQGCRVFNLYGPSETTIYATYYELKDRKYNTVPIGKPLPGVQLKIASQKENSKMAELLIGGNGVTEGYRLQPELNKAKFKLIGSNRYYVTGDYVYYQGDNLVFSSRIDSQVQVNGIRIELDEVKSIVDKLKSVKSSRVVFYKKKLVVFYEADLNIKEDIIRSLPSYLNPTVVKVESYYLNQNRKLDVPKMLEIYYYKKQSQQGDDVRKNILDVLSKFERVDITDLDSLELVRFYLEIEDIFDIEIKENDFYRLKSVDSIVDYIRNKSFFQERSTEPNDSFTKEHDLVNLEYNLTKMNYRYLKNIITPSPTQKRLYKNNQNRVIGFNLALEEVTYLELNKLHHIIKYLSYKIDIFRLVVEKEQTRFSIGIVNEGDYSPNIIVLNNLPTELELQGILDNIEVIPIPIIVVGTRDKKVRFYFPYHSIDASSLNKLGDTVYQLYEKKIVIDEVPSSSLVAFSQFKREVLQNDVSGDVLARLPKIKPAIEFEKLNDEVQCFQVSLPEDIKGDDVYLFTIYAISQCILSDYNLSAISGGLSLDFRDYEQFDAYDLIGDIHKKIPFQVNRTETFEEFKNSHFKILEIYRTGIDYYEIAMLGNDMSAKEVQERLNNLSLSINFIGEAFRLKDTINNIIDVDFDKNFINVFVHERFAYAVIKSELLSNSVYDLMHKDSKFELKVIDKKRLENEETNR